MSSEKFESLEEDFISSKNEIVRKIDNVLPYATGEHKKSTLREIQRDIDNAKHILTEIEEEIKLAPNPYSYQMNTRYKKYTQEVALFQKKIDVMNNSLFSENRLDLFSSGSSAPDPASGGAKNNRDRILQNRKIVERTTESVFRAQQVAAETDQVGVAVVDELGTQREQLIRTKERLVDTDANLSRSRKILRSMYRKVITNKLILIIAIVLELVILAVVVYYKFFRK